MSTFSSYLSESQRVLSQSGAGGSRIRSPYASSVSEGVRISPSESLVQNTLTTLFQQWLDRLASGLQKKLGEAIEWRATVKAGRPGTSASKKAAAMLDSVSDVQWGEWPRCLCDYASHLHVVKSVCMGSDHSLQALVDLCLLFAPHPVEPLLREQEALGLATTANIPSTTRWGFSYFVQTSLQPLLDQLPDGYKHIVEHVCMLAMADLLAVVVSQYNGTNVHRQSINVLLPYAFHVFRYYGVNSIAANASGLHHLTSHVGLSPALFRILGGHIVDQWAAVVARLSRFSFAATTQYIRRIIDLQSSVDPTSANDEDIVNNPLSAPTQRRLPKFSEEEVMVLFFGCRHVALRASQVVYKRGGGGDAKDKSRRVWRDLGDGELEAVQEYVEWLIRHTLSARRPGSRALLLTCIGHALRPFDWSGQNGSSHQLPVDLIFSTWETITQLASGISLSGPSASFVLWAALVDLQRLLLVRAPPEIFGENALSFVRLSLLKQCKRKEKRRARHALRELLHFLRGTADIDSDEQFLEDLADHSDAPGGAAGDDPTSSLASYELFYTRLMVGDDANSDECVVDDWHRFGSFPARALRLYGIDSFAGSEGDASSAAAQMRSHIGAFVGLLDTPTVFDSDATAANGRGNGGGGSNSDDETEYVLRNGQPSPTKRHHRVVVNNQNSQSQQQNLSPSTGSQQGDGGSGEEQHDGVTESEWNEITVNVATVQPLHLSQLHHLLSEFSDIDDTDVEQFLSHISSLYMFHSYQRLSERNPYQYLSRNLAAEDADQQLERMVLIQQKLFAPKRPRPHLKDFAPLYAAILLQMAAANLKFVSQYVLPFVLNNQEHKDLDLLRVGLLTLAAIFNPKSGFKFGIRRGPVSRRNAFEVEYTLTEMSQQYSREVLRLISEFDDRVGVAKTGGQCRVTSYRPDALYVYYFQEDGFQVPAATAEIFHGVDGPTPRLDGIDEHRWAAYFDPTGTYAGGDTSTDSRQTRIERAELKRKLQLHVFGAVPDVFRGRAVSTTVGSEAASVLEYDFAHSSGSEALWRSLRRFHLILPDDRAAASSGNAGASAADRDTVGGGSVPMGYGPFRGRHAGLNPLFNRSARSTGAPVPWWWEDLDGEYEWPSTGEETAQTTNAKDRRYVELYAVAVGLLPYVFSHIGNYVADVVHSELPTHFLGNLVVHRDRAVAAAASQAFQKVFMTSTDDGNRRQTLLQGFLTLLMHGVQSSGSGEIGAGAYGTNVSATEAVHDAPLTSAAAVQILRTMNRCLNVAYSQAIRRRVTRARSRQPRADPARADPDLYAELAAPTLRDFRRMIDAELYTEATAVALFYLCAPDVRVRLEAMELLFWLHCLTANDTGDDGDGEADATEGYTTVAGQRRGSCPSVYAILRRYEREMVERGWHRLLREEGDLDLDADFVAPLDAAAVDGTPGAAARQLPMPLLSSSSRPMRLVQSVPTLLQLMVQPAAYALYARVLAELGPRLLEHGFALSVQRLRVSYLRPRMEARYRLWIGADDFALRMSAVDSITRKRVMEWGLWHVLFMATAGTYRRPRKPLDPAAAATATAADVSDAGSVASSTAGLATAGSTATWRTQTQTHTVRSGHQQDAAAALPVYLRRIHPETARDASTLLLEPDVLNASVLPFVYRYFWPSAFRSPIAWVQYAALMACGAVHAHSRAALIMSCSALYTAMLHPDGGANAIDGHMPAAEAAKLGSVATVLSTIRHADASLRLPPVLNVAQHELILQRRNYIYRLLFRDLAEIPAEVMHAFLANARETRRQFAPRTYTEDDVSRKGNTVALKYRTREELLARVLTPLDLAVQVQAVCRLLTRRYAQYDALSPYCQAYVAVPGHVWALEDQFDTLQYLQAFSGHSEQDAVAVDACFDDAVAALFNIDRNASKKQRSGYYHDAIAQVAQYRPEALQLADDVARARHRLRVHVHRALQSLLYLQGVMSTTLVARLPQSLHWYVEAEAQFGQRGFLSSLLFHHFAELWQPCRDAFFSLYDRDDTRAALFFDALADQFLFEGPTFRYMSSTGNSPDDRLLVNDADDEGGLGALVANDYSDWTGNTGGVLEAPQQQLPYVTVDTAARLLELRTRCRALVDVDRRHPRTLRIHVADLPAAYRRRLVDIGGALMYLCLSGMVHRRPRIRHRAHRLLCHLAGVGFGLVRRPSLMAAHGIDVQTQAEIEDATLLQDDDYMRDWNRECLELRDGLVQHSAVFQSHYTGTAVVPAARVIAGRLCDKFPDVAADVWWEFLQTTHFVLSYEMDPSSSSSSGKAAGEATGDQSGVMEYVHDITGLVEPFARQLALGAYDASLTAELLTSLYSLTVRYGDRVAALMHRIWQILVEADGAGLMTDDKASSPDNGGTGDNAMVVDETHLESSNLAAVLGFLVERCTEHLVLCLDGLTPDAVRNEQSKLRHTIGVVTSMYRQYPQPVLHWLTTRLATETVLGRDAYARQQAVFALVTALVGESDVFAAVYTYLPKLLIHAVLRFDSGAAPVEFQYARHFLARVLDAHVAFLLKNFAASEVFNATATPADKLRTDAELQRIVCHCRLLLQCVERPNFRLAWPALDATRMQVSVDALKAVSREMEGGGMAQPSEEAGETESEDAGKPSCGRHPDRSLMAYVLRRALTGAQAMSAEQRARAQQSLRHELASRGAAYADEQWDIYVAAATGVLDPTVCMRVLLDVFGTPVITRVAGRAHPYLQGFQPARMADRVGLALLELMTVTEVQAMVAFADLDPEEEDREREAGGGESAATVSVPGLAQLSEAYFHHSILLLKALAVFVAVATPINEATLLTLLKIAYNSSSILHRRHFVNSDNNDGDKAGEKPTGGSISGGIVGLEVLDRQLRTDMLVHVLRVFEHVVSAADSAFAAHGDDDWALFPLMLWPTYAAMSSPIAPVYIQAVRTMHAWLTSPRWKARVARLGGDSGGNAAESPMPAVWLEQWTTLVTLLYHQAPPDREPLVHAYHANMVEHGLLLPIYDGLLGSVVDPRARNAPSHAARAHTRRLLYAILEAGDPVLFQTMFGRSPDRYYLAVLAVLPTLYNYFDAQAARNASASGSCAAPRPAVPVGAVESADLDDVRVLRRVVAGLAALYRRSPSEPEGEAVAAVLETWGSGRVRDANAWLRHVCAVLERTYLPEYAPQTSHFLLRVLRSASRDLHVPALKIAWCMCSATHLPHFRDVIAWASHLLNRRPLHRNTAVVAQHLLAAAVDRAQSSSGVHGHQQQSQQQPTSLILSAEPWPEPSSDRHDAEQSVMVVHFMYTMVDYYQQHCRRHHFDALKLLDSALYAYSAAAAAAITAPPKAQQISTASRGFVPTSIASNAGDNRSANTVTHTPTKMSDVTRSKLNRSLRAVEFQSKLLHFVKAQAQHGSGSHAGDDTASEANSVEAGRSNVRHSTGGAGFPAHLVPHARRGDPDDVRSEGAHARGPRLSMSALIDGDGGGVGGGDRRSVMSMPVHGHGRGMQDTATATSSDAGGDADVKSRFYYHLQRMKEQLHEERAAAPKPGNRIAEVAERLGALAVERAERAERVRDDDTVSVASVQSRVSTIVAEAPPLTHMLQDRTTWRPILAQFVCDRFPQAYRHVLDFYDAHLAFMRDADPTAAADLVARFLRPTAAQSLPLRALVREEVLRDFDRTAGGLIAPTLFRKVSDEVKNILAREVYPAFIRSPQYRATAHQAR